MSIQTKAKLAAILLGTILVGLFLYLNADKLFSEEIRDQELTDFNRVYLATEEIQAAQKKLQSGQVAPANILTPERTGKKRIALVFDGLPEHEDTRQLLALLEKYHSKAVFFVEGENAADNLETIALIKEAGQKIGNYTFVGLPELHKYKTEVILAELYRTQGVLYQETGEAPTMFRGPRLSLTEPVLKAASAVGLKAAVYSNIKYIPHTLHNDQEADSYVAGISHGSIIAIPIGVPAEMPIPVAKTEDNSPAMDKKGTLPPLKAKDSSGVAMPKEKNIIEEMDLLLAACQRRGLNIEFVDDFRLIKYLPQAK